MTTTTDIRAAISETVQDIIDDAEPDNDREWLIERMDEECDALFGRLVRHGRIDQYDVDDLLEAIGPCAAIISLAKQEAWVEDDSGLWEGLTYGVVPSIAYFSLRNLLYQALADAGHDSNDDLPFAPEGDDD